MRSSLFATARGTIPRLVLGDRVAELGLVSIAIGLLGGCGASVPPLPDHYWLDHATLPSAHREWTAREKEALDHVLDIEKETWTAHSAPTPP